MRRAGIFLFLFIPTILFGEDYNTLRLFFIHISKLDFSKAEEIALREPDLSLRSEMCQLSKILMYEGQTERANFEFAALDIPIDNSTLAIIRSLEEGYLGLFYDRVKGNAYKKFYSAYQLAKEGNDDILLKACLHAMLKYYGNEIAQNSNSFLPYLKQFEEIQSDTIDRVWVTIYKSIFYTKSLEHLDSGYFHLSKKLFECENNLLPKSPLLSRVYFEHALEYESRNELPDAKAYYKRAIKQSENYKFLRHLRFSSFIKLASIGTRTDHFEDAERALEDAHGEINLADTLRSQYYLNLYGAFLLNAQNKNDSAFKLLKLAYEQDFQLDFRRNTLEINRLSVELETHEKENTNLKLIQDKNWLISALVAGGLLAILAYLLYANQRSKTNMQLQQKEMQSMKLEKQLKDQEILSIDTMIEAQEKERQRIANDLHDNLGSLLATIQLHFQNLSLRNHPNNQSDPSFQKTDDLIKEAYQKVRTIAHQRNLGVNSKEGLMSAVNSFASKVTLINKLSIQVEEHGMDIRLENSLEITLFRIIQETITNVIKHAQATEVIIHLTRHKGSINIMVEDDGVGFDVSKIQPGTTMGLYSIQKRIENLGGSVSIDSILQRGTTIIIDIPLPL